jgi:uncharacterized LabA/DUF88 family protein
MVLFDGDYRIFVDYDNLTEELKSKGLLDLVRKILFELEHDRLLKRVKCNIRVYGGWYEGANLTNLAEKIVLETLRDFPKTTCIDGISLLIEAEVAFSLIEEPAHHLFNTYRRKAKPNNIRIKSQEFVGCSETNCLIPQIKKLFKTGKCPKSGCTIDTRLLYRNEQKIVDTMLTCDIVYSSQLGPNLVVLVSSDDDFLPPIRSISLRGIRTLRCHTKANEQRCMIESHDSLFKEMEI